MKSRNRSVKITLKGDHNRRAYSIVKLEGAVHIQLRGWAGGLGVGSAPTESMVQQMIDEGFNVTILAQ